MSFKWGEILPTYVLVVEKLSWWNENNAKKLLFLSGAVFFVIYFFYLIKGLIFSLGLAVLLTYLLDPLVSILEKRGTSRTGAILLVYLALFFFGAGIFLYGLPRTIEQLNTLAETIPQYTEQVQDIVRSVQSRYVSLSIPEGMRQVIDERFRWLENIILQQVRLTVASLIGAAGYVFKIILAPVLAFYFLKDLELIKRKTIKILPEEWRNDVAGILREIDRVLGSYVRGYFSVAAIVGGLTAASMAFLGMEFAMMLGLIAGITELIPYFGPVIGAVPAVCLAILHSKWLAVKVALAFLIIHQLEGNIISPKILGDKVGLHPLVVIFSLFAGGELYGLTGMLLAVPVAAVLRVILSFIYGKVFVC
ncbi:AI-2E family transporter [Pelotomaculum terephthalicicum JT]|uniref:AI-2E family transporter n=1 Tax=Pelotomaculum TaxID=191373 RepID=UPI0009CC84D7|nr:MULTISPECIES: AI-2E family transporter [Pelotomaculum]MCG9969071.1 AI-2E family transporter [Pelotomaculum terephthalicicum JT]OPX87409.1 MAG: AI-2 transport protein TqsA [Pelotomaculum sp. PtaB.Bin117]OPY60896.1 MAG: AI-2 transport protein TqsA [Pelotomaculum sp. PtaU1.Bin065]